MAVLSAIAAAAAIVSCVDAVGPGGAKPEVSPVQVQPSAPAWFGLNFLACTPITADSVTQAVDSTGGTIEVGPHKLIIPAGALDTAVSITAIAPSDTLNRVRLYPEGLEFDEKVSLKLSYANCDPISIFLPKRVAYVDSSFNILDVLLSLDAFWTQTTTARLEHFSDYVVAW